MGRQLEFVFAPSTNGAGERARPRAGVDRVRAELARRPDRTVNELAAATGLSRPAVLRALDVLGAVERKRWHEPPRYRLEGEAPEDADDLDWERHDLLLAKERAATEEERRLAVQRGERFARPTCRCSRPLLFAGVDDEAVCLRCGREPE